MLTKGELVEAIQEECDSEFSKAEVREIIAAIVCVAQEEIAAGEDFKIDGLCRVTYRYTTPRKKGEKYVNPITKETLTAEKARPAAIAIRAAPASPLKKLVPKINSKGGKAVVTRKSK